MTPTSLFLQRLLGSAAPVAAAAVAEYTVDELAQAAQTTVRNVRAYQDRGLLPPPERRGRVGIYSGEHLARLRLIGQLLERGYSIANIRELFEAWSQGRDLAHVLGLEQAIRGPGEPEQPGRLEFAELQAIFADDLDDELIDRAQAMGLLQFAGDHLSVPSPRLFAAGVELYRAGIPLPALLDELESIRRHVEQVSTGIVQMIVGHLVNPLLQSALPRADQLEDLSTQLLRLRPLVEQVVEAELARGLPVAANRELSERVHQLLQGFLQRSQG
ncbi:MerR family transcriptional regulator [Ectopseudomonas hydrolytica]|uniref:MerR family transcriptional regulator n=1 Tax=Ectopseudomonas hydrolytica TaxID=2493633 RepID=UPI0018A7A075|nr:MerR family transcriptional regulator [Pseudomonas hydrolytica]MBF8161798.1 MerR family transcriptional regulator [Pseudomonas mendocina]UTH30588.1 MerR family transcriptional regulator [Pseudomonas hydrolytica]UZZ09771.1 MerR family transcriptional regulator [Pseudomonas mendocina]